MKKGYKSMIENRMEEIRQIVRTYQNEIDRQTKKYTRQAEIKSERLRPDAFAEDDRTDRAILMGNIDAAITQAEINVNVVFDDIEKVVAEWIASPPSADFTAVMACVDRFDLKLSRTEIEMLSTLAAGSYIGWKVLDQYAAANAMSCNFQSADRIKQMISAARSDVLTAVRCYCGQDSAFSWITGETIPSFRRAFAASYLGMERTSLHDLAEVLNATMNPAVSLLPDEKERLQKYFDGYTGEDRIARMIELITADPDDADRFSLYDKDIYDAARQQIREQKIAEDQAAQEAVREASAAALKAHVDAVRARLSE